jgi:hypothetical protein
MIKQLIEKFKQQTNDEFYAKLEAEGQARAKRNAERIEKIKQEMGEKWIMHPSHTRGKLDEPRPV